jgi:CheY-like chemotaxis protein
MVGKLLRMAFLKVCYFKAARILRKTSCLKCDFLLHLQSMPAEKHAHTILYAEDDADDLFMIRQAFEQFDGTTELRHASNGFEALEQLNEAKDKKRLPCLVILDINMPGMNGREALIRIRQSEDFKEIPVVLFTTSSSELDKSFARKWSAEFITKPLVFSELEELARRFLSLCTSSVSERA